MLKTLHNKLYYSYKFKLFKMICNVCRILVTWHVIYACIKQILKCYTAYAIYNMFYNINTKAIQYRDLCYVTIFMLYNKKKHVKEHIPTFQMAWFEEGKETTRQWLLFMRQWTENRSQILYRDHDSDPTPSRRIRHSSRAWPRAGSP